MNIYGITDRGRVRTQNQDAFYEWTDGTYAVLLVCDGMGGAKAGNVASTLAAQQFAEVLAQSHGGVQERLRDALAQANEAIYTRSRQDAACQGMGTTLVAAFAGEGRAYFINVGDSRAYYLTPDGIRQVTRDHSLVAELVESGRLTEEEARSHPNRNVITRALGTAGDVIGDIFEVDLEEDSRLLLCSDGLSNLVTPEEMLQTALAEGRVADCCARLVALALERGAPDNVTVVMLDTVPKSA
ncbi:MAG: Stp1/IreP family PP2C-type Ser/Thr phosphatase [Clostridiales bacterium]|nr:Stp1/IreP family PP2C-type Ser/Thr phosphatase [Clostridiales bacterium]